eukprot:scaffold64490_cov17-Tisochrysis_lutea.AAC.1
MRSRTCNPCPGVSMREALVFGLLLIVYVEQVSNEWQGQFAWRALSCACMHACMSEAGLLLQEGP